MDDKSNIVSPKALSAIEAETKKIGFKMASDYQTGCLLRSLASSKPSGRMLELGTGTGLSAAWMLDGMDGQSRLFSVDNDEQAIEVARRNLSSDLRVSFFLEDGSIFLTKLAGQTFDLIFADTWPGKIWDLEKALDLFAEGGLYVVDDMTKQPHWPDDHYPKIVELIRNLEARSDLLITKLDWSTGIMIVTRQSNQAQ